MTALSPDNTVSSGNSDLKYVNLGCGFRFHKDWINVDIVSSSPEVIEHNIIKGLPFKSNSVDLIYHSHVLEHLPKSKAPNFIKECYRVLKPGGVIRVVVPDLERIALAYIKQLNDARNNVPNASYNYDWMMLEMIDQCVRQETGGEMLKFLQRDDLPNEDFIYERVGNEAKQIRDAYLKNPVRRKGLKKKLLSFFKKIPILETYFEGKYRSHGEIHQWMYDSYSLSHLLTAAGFGRVQVRTAFESYIANWSSFELDSRNGIPFKPDSLYIEAIKP